jgi:hypothetical protein
MEPKVDWDWKSMDNSSRLQISNSRGLDQSAEGTPYNSPAFQRWVSKPQKKASRFQEACV